MTTAEIEELAQRIAQRVVRDMGHAQARTLTLAQAAKALGRSSRTVARMVQAGALFTCEVGGARMVPLSEIERIATPTATVRTPRKRAAKSRRGGTGADKIRAALKKR